ncbi:hypothetical protein BC7_00052 [Bacillus phage BC-7]|nr:hypothetical protein BC7_00052 [Bacillus phage BC-7]
MNKKDYFKKRNKLVESFNRKDISYQDFTTQMATLAQHFKPEWGNELSERGRNLGSMILDRVGENNNYGLGRKVSGGAKVR